jgi:hypothetical protein
MGDVIAVFVLAMVTFSGWGLFIFSVMHKSYDGQVVVTKTPEGKTIYTLELDIDPEEIRNMFSLSFKVLDEDNFLK